MKFTQFIFTLLSGTLFTFGLLCCLDTTPLPKEKVTMSIEADSQIIDPIDTSTKRAEAKMGSGVTRVGSSYTFIGRGVSGVINNGSGTGTTSGTQWTTDSPNLGLTIGPGEMVTISYPVGFNLVPWDSSKQTVTFGEASIVKDQQPAIVDGLQYSGDYPSQINYPEYRNFLDKGEQDIIIYDNGVWHTVYSSRSLVNPTIVNFSVLVPEGGKADTATIIQITDTLRQILLQNDPKTIHWINLPNKLGGGDSVADNDTVSIYYIIKGNPVLLTMSEIDENDPNIEWTILVGEPYVLMIAGPATNDEAFQKLERQLSDCLTFFPYANLLSVSTTQHICKFRLKAGINFGELNLIGCLR